MSIFGSIFGILGKVTDILGHVNQAVGAVEAFSKVLKGQGTNVTGEMKQELARTYVKEMIASTELLIGKEVVDEEAFDKAINLIIDGVVGVMNSVK